MSQFQAVLSLPDSVTDQIRTRLRFPNSDTLESSMRARTVTRFDLNTSPAEKFERVYGIGPVLSKRIVKYRQALGGFVEKDQLFEVYGLDSTLVEKALQSFILFEPVHVRKLDLQKASEEELARHPYISEQHARRIILFRELEEKQLQESDLRVLLDVSNKKFNRIRLYLQF